MIIYLVFITVITLIFKEYGHLLLVSFKLYFQNLTALLKCQKQSASVSEMLLFASVVTANISADVQYEVTLVVM